MQNKGIRFQKRVAKKLKGTYLGKHYLGESVGDVDIDSYFHIECKMEGIPKYIDKTLQQSFMDSMRGYRVDKDSVSANRSKWSIAVLGEEGREWGNNVVVMKLSDFSEILDIVMEKLNADAEKMS